MGVGVHILTVRNKSLKSDSGSGCRRFIELANVESPAPAKAHNEYDLDFLTRGKGPLHIAVKDRFAELKRMIHRTNTVGEVHSAQEANIKRTGRKALVGELPDTRGDPSQITPLFQNVIRVLGLRCNNRSKWRSAVSNSR